MSGMAARTSDSSAGSTVSGTGNPMRWAAACCPALSMYGCRSAHRLQGMRNHSPSRASCGPMTSMASSCVGNSTPGAGSVRPSASRSAMNPSGSSTGSRITWARACRDSMPSARGSRSVAITGMSRAASERMMPSELGPDACSTTPTPSVTVLTR